MNPNTQSGFTIIELSLVLAISSLMLVMMMAGITLAVQQQRFSDSVNGTQSFLQAQFNETQNTINNRSSGSCDPDNPGSPSADLSIRGASDCLILGKLLEISESTGNNESTIKTYDVIAQSVDTEVPPYEDRDDLKLIRTIKPTVIRQGDLDETYIVPWGAHINDIRDDTDKSGSNVVRFIALLRSPRSGVIHVYKIRSTTPLAADATLLSPTGAEGDTNISEIENDSVKMCMNSIDLIKYNAMLAISPTGSQDGITSHFDDTQKDAYQC